MNNQLSESKIAIVGNQPEALLISTLFAEAGQQNFFVGHFDEAKTRRKETGGLAEARRVLGGHPKAGKKHLLSNVEEISTISPSIFILTSHAVSQKETSVL